MAKTSDLETRVAVLEKLLDRVLDSISECKVATKTADKALQMAQEALVIITSGKNEAPAQDMPWDIPQNMKEAIGSESKGNNAGSSPVLPELNEADLI